MQRKERLEDTFQDRKYVKELNLLNKKLQKYDENLHVKNLLAQELHGEYNKVRANPPSKGEVMEQTKEAAELDAFQIQKAEMEMIVDQSEKSAKKLQDLLSGSKEDMTVTRTLLDESGVLDGAQNIELGDDSAYFQMMVFLTEEQFHDTALSILKDLNIPKTDRSKIDGAKQNLLMKQKPTKSQSDAIRRTMAKLPKFLDQNVELDSTLETVNKYLGVLLDTFSKKEVRQAVHDVVSAKDFPPIPEGVKPPSQSVNQLSDQGRDAATSAPSSPDLTPRKLIKSLSLLDEIAEGKKLRKTPVTTSGPSGKESKQKKEKTGSPLGDALSDAMDKRRAALRVDVTSDDDEDFDFDDKVGSGVKPKVSLKTAAKKTASYPKGKWGQVVNGKLGDLVINERKLNLRELHAKQGRKIVATGKVSKGLYDLLKKRYETRNNYTDEDKRVYKRLIELSNLPINVRNRKAEMVRKLFDKTTSQRDHRSLRPRGGPSGKEQKDQTAKPAQPKTKTKYVYYDSPDDLLKRMDVLVGTVESGNNSDTVKEELSQILNKLKDGGAISDVDYVNLWENLVE